LQQEVIIADFVRVDFFVPELNLIIEVDGPLHENGISHSNKKSQMKKMVLERLGYTVCNINAI
jgi:very-short-patch-repair endonuclease